VARLRHPNIVQIYQIGEADGLPYVVFEYLEGGTLARRLAGTPQPAREAAALLVTLAGAAEAAHRAGIVHRDLKPSNVLFDVDGLPKIADFGLAKRLEVEEGDTRTGQVIGTPSYMAPEQAQGRVRDVGPATDVYALGAILYEMLTGRPPLKGTTSAETLMLVQNEDPVPPSRLRPGFPRDLETICLKCLSKEPSKRYASASALADDLKQFLDGKPIRARRTPAWERGAKWARRHPAASALGSAALVAAAAVIGLGLRAEAASRARARREDDRIAGLRTEVGQTLFRGQWALAQERWDDVRGIVFRALSRIEAEPRLADLKDSAEGLLEQARRGLEDRQARESDRARYRRFLEARDEAFFLDTRFTGIDSPVDLEATRKAARAGLAAFGTVARDDRWALNPLPRFLSAQERAEVERGFYELLLVLADAVSQSPGDGPTARAAEALAVLDRAARLRPSRTRAYHLRRAALLGVIGDDEGKAREEAAAGRLAPANAFDFFLSGRERAKRQEWPAAARDFEAALQRQPDHFWAQCLLAVCHLQTRQPSKARPGLNACLQRKPDLVWLYLLRGIAYAQGAELALDLAARYPDQSAPLETEARAQFEAAEEDYRRALAFLDGRPDEPKLRYALLVNRGLIRLEQRHFADADADFRAAIRLDGRRYEAYSSLGEVYRREGHASDALVQFDRAIALRPGWAPLYRGRAEVCVTTNDPTPAQRDAALADLDDAIRCESAGSPLVAADLAKKARLLHQAGRAEEALAACEAALELAPRDVDTHRLRIKVLLDLKRYGELIASCNTALASAAPSADLYELRGMARDHSGDHAGAVADYTSALTLRPDAPRVLARRGWSYLLTDAPRPALLDFDAAIRLDPSSSDAYNGRGTARVRLGKYREAVADAESSLAHGTPAWRTFYNAARIFSYASTAAASDTRTEARAAALLVSRYQNRSLGLLRRALDHLPASRRATFWHETVIDDPAFQPVRRRLRTLADTLAKGG
jgi:tetratricopeptide (TPR) repeat protein